MILAEVHTGSDIFKSRLTAEVLRQELNGVLDALIVITSVIIGQFDPCGLLLRSTAYCTAASC